MGTFTVDNDDNENAVVPIGKPPRSIERRSADRPWNATKEPQEAEEAAAPAQQLKAAANGSDQQWEEF